MPNRIMVTGGNGFLGAHLVRHLVERGDQVLIYDFAQPSDKTAWLLKDLRQDLIYERGSIEDVTTLFEVTRTHRIEKVVHCAGIVDLPYLNQNPMTAFRINVAGTMNVLEAVRLLGLERIVLASTNGVLTTKQYDPVDEDHPVLLPEGPASGFYGASKLCCEAFGMAYWAYQKVNFLALRPSTFYGFGMKLAFHYIKPIIEDSVRGLPVKLAKGGNTPRDYVYIKDMVSAFVKAIDVDKEHIKDRIFMIGTGKKLVTPAEAAKIVKEIVPNCRIEMDEHSPNRDEIKHRGVINIDRARSQLGYEPRYDFRAGIEDYIKMYQEFLES